MIYGIFIGIPIILGKMIRMKSESASEWGISWTSTSSRMMGIGWLIHRGFPKLPIQPM